MYECVEIINNHIVYIVYVSKRGGCTGSGGLKKIGERSNSTESKKTNIRLPSFNLIKDLQVIRDSTLTRFRNFPKG